MVKEIIFRGIASILPVAGIVVVFFVPSMIQKGTLDFEDDADMLSPKVTGIIIKAAMGAMIVLCLFTLIAVWA